jgi:hypothetical protein
MVLEQDRDVVTRSQTGGKHHLSETFRIVHQFPMRHNDA